MKTREKALLDAMATIHRRALEDMIHVVSEFRKSTDLSEMADTAFVLKEVAALADHIRKECNRELALLSQIFTAMWAMSPEVDGKAVSTDYCTVYPDPVKRAAIPSFTKSPDEYALLMRDIGIPENVIKDGLVMLHWDRYGDYLTNLERTGAPPIEGSRAQRLYTEFRLRIRRKRGVVPSSPVAGVDEED